MTSTQHPATRLLIAQMELRRAADMAVRASASAARDPRFEPALLVARDAVARTIADLQMAVQAVQDSRSNA